MIIGDPPPAHIVPAECGKEVYHGISGARPAVEEMGRERLTQRRKDAKDSIAIPQ
jgi:hypothetical protein